MMMMMMNLYSAFFCKKNPKRAACASLVERKEKGFEVVFSAVFKPHLFTFSRRLAGN